MGCDKHTYIHLAAFEGIARMSWFCHELKSIRYIEDWGHSTVLRDACQYRELAWDEQGHQDRRGILKRDLLTGTKPWDGPAVLERSRIRRRGFEDLATRSRRTIHEQGFAE